MERRGKALIRCGPCLVFLSLSLSLYEKARAARVAASEDDNLIASGEKTNEKRGRRWN